MSVTVETTETGGVFAFDNRAPILDFTGFLEADGRNYDVSPDGRRFLFLKAIAGDGGSDAVAPGITIDLSFFEELKRLMPTN